MAPLYKFNTVRNADAADFDCVRVTLFSGEFHVCGWYLSPTIAGLTMDGYVPKSANLIASSAVLRAMTAANQLGIDVCIIDPDNLWDSVWSGL